MWDRNDPKNGFDAGTYFQIAYNGGGDEVTVYRMEKWNDKYHLGDFVAKAKMEFDSLESAKEYLDSLGKWIQV